MNYDELKTNLNKIIDNSESIDKRQKTILKTLFSNLSDFDKTRLDELKAEVTDKIQEKEFSIEKIENIVTALVKKNDEYDGFSDIIEEKEFPKDFIGAFFNCSYIDFLKITDNNPYTEHQIKINYGNSWIDVNCRFEADYSFVNKEQYLNKLVQQYSINTPVIFSPYARKFAKLVITDVAIKVENIKDIKFNDKLDESIFGTTLDYKLVWNVEIVEKVVPSLGSDIDNIILERIKINKEPFASNSYFIPNKAITQKKNIYKCENKQFILFHGIGDKKIGIGRNLNEDRLYILCDGNMNIEPYVKISIKDIDEEKLNSPIFYRNFYSQALLNLPRIRTRADILFVINAFNSNPYSILVGFSDSSLQDCKSLEDNDIIFDYDEPHKYYRRSSDRLSKSIRLKGTTDVCLYFNGKNRILTEDYARYVLSYLNERYPEFHWIGRYKE